MYKNQFFRKGFIYKPFSIKQINSSNVSPTSDERQAFFDIYNEFMKNDQDSSEMGNEKTKNFIKKDVMLDINVGDKIFIKGGDLQGTIGNIINFEKNG